MAKIYRCPACGALWKVPDSSTPSRLQCSECRTVFAADKAEMARVDDDKLAERLATQRALRASEPDPERVMSDIANSMSDFDSRAPSQRMTPRDESSGFGWLWSLLAFILLCGVLAVAALWGHRYVIAQLPVVEPLYAKVCRHVPCPGFTWSDANAIRTAAALSPDPANPHHSVVTLTLVNQSKFAQRLPTLEIRFLDAAGDTMAIKLLEPGNYGLPADTVLTPSQKAKVTLTPDTAFTVPPAAVRITPMGESR
ncbi:MAG: zinc-ribbon and DUF3426 domain-containing protein [Sutterella sp.]|nr:zinc-ribbon and DUF3426 domain-containing protein [Sutterella sp.]